MILTARGVQFMAKKKPVKRGPKGGMKHTPGRGHDRKSRSRKDKKRVKKARQRREELEAEACRQWEAGRTHLQVVSTGEFASLIL